MTRNAKDVKKVKRSADSGEKAYEVIRRQLVEFKLKPQQRINEMALAKTLGISRTPIREALNRLASEGFVALTPNRGFFFKALDTEALLDLYELRAIIECGAFELMCKRASDAELARLRDYWDGVKVNYTARDPDEILGLDEGFHLLIAELSGNPEIGNQLSAINARIRFIRRIQIQHKSHDEGFVSVHQKIVDAGLERDVVRGTALLREHIEMTVSAAQHALKDALLAAYMHDKPLGSRRKRVAAA